jgi:excisionase family DNA binding protein
MRANDTATPALLLTPKQAAETLAISPRKLWSLTASGRIPSIRIDRCVRYSVDDIQLWIDQQKIGGGDR